MSNNKGEKSSVAVIQTHTRRTYMNGWTGLEDKPTDKPRGPSLWQASSQTPRQCPLQLSSMGFVRPAKTAEI